MQICTAFGGSRAVNWDDLKYVLAVTRGRSFQGASRLLKVSHTTVSRRISALEEQFGAVLFHRDHNTCTPTQACMPLIEPALRIEAEIDKIYGNVEDTTGNPTGHVRIVTGPWIASYVLAPALPKLYGRYPGLKLQMIGEFFNSGAYPPMATIFLRFALTPTQSQLAASVARITYAVYGPKGHDPDSLEWATFHTNLQGYAPSDWLSTHGIGFHQVQTSASDAAFIHPAIRAGLGKGLIPDWIGARDPELVRLSGPEPEITRVLRVIADTDVFSFPRVRAVVGWVESVFANPENVKVDSPV